MPNILIVEDDININNLLCEVLRKAGYTCEQAFSGTEAKLLLDIKEKAYTLVLLDLMLPCPSCIPAFVFTSVSASVSASASLFVSASI